MLRRLLALLGCLMLLAACDVVVNTSAAQPSVSVTAVAEQPVATAAPVDETGNKSGDSGVEATENLLKTIVTYLAFFAEVCGAIIIGVAVLREFARYVPHVFRSGRDSEDYQEDIRLRLGKSLALALEFELGADILRTAVAPTFNVIAITAAIIALRTLLNYFLERELREVEQRRAGERRTAEQPLRTAKEYPADTRG